MSDPTDQGTVSWSKEYQQFYRQTFDKATREWVTEWLQTGSVPQLVEAAPSTPQPQTQRTRTASSSKRRDSGANSTSSPKSISSYTSGTAGHHSLTANATPFVVSSTYPVLGNVSEQPSTSFDPGTAISNANLWNNENSASYYPSNELQEQSVYPHASISSTWLQQDAQQHPLPEHGSEYAASSTGSNMSMPRGRGGQIVGTYTGSGPEGSSTTEKVDASFRVRKSQWFVDGRVFAVVMNETAGQNATLGYLTNSNRNINPVKWQDNLVHTQIRRFVVVRRKKEFCYACPIFTYGGKGTTKRGVRPEEHGIIYSDGQQAHTLAGETGITKKPIRVKMTKGVENLHRASRVYYGIHHPIQHNVKVKDIGQVAQSHMPSLIGNWKAEDGKESAGFSGPIAEEVGEASSSHPPPNQPDPDRYHPTENIYGYDKAINPDMYHPTYNPYGYHPAKNKVGYHPQSNNFSYHPEHNPYGYHPQRTPFCYHPAFCPFGYHSTVNPMGYHPKTMPFNYHPQANEYGYHKDLNPYGFHPSINPSGFHPTENPGAYHPEHNPSGIHESGSDDEGEEGGDYEDDDEEDDSDDSEYEEKMIVQ